MSNYHFNKLNPPFIIAIDGPGASGKSVLGETIARYLGFGFLDTGKIYRLLTWFFQNEGLDFQNISIKRLKQKLPFFCQSFSFQGGQFYFHDQVVDDSDIYNVRIDFLLPFLVNYSFIREIVVRFSQKCIDNQNYVLVGRDTTTVIAPFANLKFFLNASASVRCERKRFFILLKEKKHLISPNTFLYQKNQIIHDLKRRDMNDINRKNGPLKIAAQAFEIWNNANDFKEVLERMLKIVYVKFYSDFFPNDFLQTKKKL